MQKMEIIRAVIEMTGMGILNSRDSFRLIEKIVKSNKQSKYGEKQKPTTLTEEDSDEVNDLYKKVSKPILETKPKLKCKDCGSEDYPNHNEGCTMGELGWEKVEE